MNGPALSLASEVLILINRILDLVDRETAHQLLDRQAVIRSNIDFAAAMREKFQGQGEKEAPLVGPSDEDTPQTG